MVDTKAEIGHRYGQLTVIDFAGVSQLNHQPIWTCQCQCGRKVICSTKNLHNYENLACPKCMEAHQ